MKQQNIDAFKQLFTAQEKLEQQVQIYNTVSSTGDHTNVHNAMAIMGGDPRPQLAELNSHIDQVLGQLETNLATKQAQLAENRTIVNKNREEVVKMRASNQANAEDLKKKQAASTMLQKQIEEKEDQHKSVLLQQKQAMQDNVDMVDSMAIPQRSFVLQKALINNVEEIISLMMSQEVDPHFRNGDGVSLMQTATEVNNQAIIDKLSPSALPKSYMPPVLPTDTENSTKMTKADSTSSSQPQKTELEKLTGALSICNF